MLVEEGSAKAALELLLPRILGATTFNLHAHQGKPDLLGKLEARLTGYSGWVPESWRVLVLVDCDADTCSALKARLEAAASAAGLFTRSRRGRAGRFAVVTRIAIEELEAWYFGDWEAVRAAYPRVARTLPAKEGFRDPDSIAGGTCEALERVLQRAGYFRTGLRKLEVARAIAAHMVPDRNTSRSFQVFRAALAEMAA
ncbi:MAG: DUF4276 family protein [Polyangiaceae bacterium]|nr:DUF4276 family protein [Polyangiaceae bacterium]